MSEEQRLALLLPMDYALNDLPKCPLNQEDCSRIQQGQAVQRPEVTIGSQWRLYSDSGSFLGIGYGKQEGVLQPKRLLASQNH